MVTSTAEPHGQRGAVWAFLDLIAIPARRAMALTVSASGTTRPTFRRSPKALLTALKHDLDAVP